MSCSYNLEILDLKILKICILVADYYTVVMIIP